MGAYEDQKRWQRDRQRQQDVRRQQESLSATQQQRFAFWRDQNDFYGTGSESFKSLARLTYYVSMSDPSLGPFINVARQKGVQAYLSGLRSWTHQFRIGIASVKVVLRGRKCFIQLDPLDFFYCEFGATTPYLQFYNHPTFGYSGYDGVIVGVDVSVKNGQTKTEARIVKGKRSLEFGQDISQIKRPWQVNMLCEPLAYPEGVVFGTRKQYPFGLMWSWAPGNPHTGYPLRGTCYPGDVNNIAIGGTTSIFQTNVGPVEPTIYRDIGFDVPYMDVHNDDPIRTAYIRGTADWPRANGVQVVEHASFGEREFAIYMDAHNQIAVFPTAAIEALTAPVTQNVDELYVTRVTPTLPSWVFVPASKWTSYYGDPPNHDLLTAALIDGPELHWHFTEDGKHCASIAVERKAYNFDSTYWTTYASGTPFNTAAFNDVRDVMGSPARQNFLAFPGYNDQRYFTAPGIISIDITITITGPNLEDYTVSTNVNEVSRPNVDGAVPMLCGYVWYDIYQPDGKTKIASKGDLCSLDVEGWYNGGYLTGPARHHTLVVLRNITQGKELAAHLECPVLAVDFTTLSYVVKPQVLETDVQTTYPGKPGHGGPYTLDSLAYHFGVAVYSQGRFSSAMFPATLPGDKQGELEAIIATDGRAYINDLLAADPTWTRVPLVSSNDDWTNDDVAGVRDHYGRTWGYTSGAPADRASFHDMDWLLNDAYHPDTGANGFIYYSTTPMWGWTFYHSALLSYMHVNSSHAYWTHPNGTWCFFANSFLYDRNLMPNSLTEFDARNSDSLSTYDASLVEHVVFDQIHFELRANNKPIGHVDSSFVKLYNAAVRSGKAAKSLEENIEEITPAHLRATFAAETYVDTVTVGQQWLQLRADWDGASYWFPETGYQGGSYVDPFPIPQQGPLVGAGMDSTWIDAADYAGGGVVPYSIDPHVRFTGLTIVEPRQANG